MEKKILNLGSGQKNYNKGIRLDINPDVNPDVLHDLNKFPYPFENNTFDAHQIILNLAFRICFVCVFCFCCSFRLSVDPSSLDGRLISLAF